MGEWSSSHRRWWYRGLQISARSCADLSTCVMTIVSFILRNSSLLSRKRRMVSWAMGSAKSCVTRGFSFSRIFSFQASRAVLSWHRFRLAAMSMNWSRPSVIAGRIPPGCNSDLYFLPLSQSDLSFGSFIWEGSVVTTCPCISKEESVLKAWHGQVCAAGRAGCISLEMQGSQLSLV